MSRVKPPYQREVLLVWGLFAVLAYFPLFLNLDVLPLRIWDEARLAVNALEMTKNHQILVTYYDGTPDLWNTKPPLLIWCQALLFMIMGPGELALRLPSAICGLFTGAALVYACWKWLDRPWMGLMAALIMVTSYGYIDMHVVRGGDYDSMLTMFMFIVVLSVFRYEQSRSPKALSFLFIALTGAILTKSVQGLMILPGCALYLLFTGAWRDFLKAKRTWLGLLGLIVIVAAYYLGREAMESGYLKAVWENELGGRYGTVLEDHRGPWSFFIEQMIRYHFDYWYLLIPCSIVIGMAHRDLRMRRWALMLICTGSTYLIAISSAATKCEWYEAPLYPMLAGLGAISLHAVFTWLRETRPLEAQIRINATPFLALFVAFAFPYSVMFNHVYHLDEWPWDKEFYQPLHYVKDIARGSREPVADLYCYEGYSSPLFFYATIITDKGHPLRAVDKADLKPGERVLASQREVKEYIGSNYTYRIIESKDEVNVYEITGITHEQP